MSLPVDETLRLKQYDRERLARMTSPVIRPAIPDENMTPYLREMENFIVRDDRERLGRMLVEANAKIQRLEAELVLLREVQKPYVAEIIAEAEKAEK